MSAIWRQGEKLKPGARRIRNGKEEMWNGKEWGPAPNHNGKKEEKPTPTQNKPKRLAGSTGGRGGSFYTVAGITYDRKTGRPVLVPKNRQPVKAQDNTKKDTPPTPTPPPSSSDSERKPKTGQGSQGFREGDKDLGKATGIRASGSKTEPAKPKSRLEKALSGIGKWEEPKEKAKRNKPTSRFLKKTNNSRRKER